MSDLRKENMGIDSMRAVTALIDLKQDCLLVTSNQTQMHRKLASCVCLRALAVSVKRQKRTDNLLLKDRKKKNEIMNSPRTKLHICKLRRTRPCFSLQKSSFLANAPQDIEYLADYKFWTMKYEI